MRCGAIIVATIMGSLGGGLALALAQEQEQEQEQETPQSPGDVAATMIGAWEFSNADRDRICRFVLGKEAAGQGYRIEIDKNCPNLFPSTKAIAAWAADNYGNLRFIDAQGNAVIELTQVEGGIYDGFNPEEGRYILQSAAAVPVRSAEEMTGDWAIARGSGKPICALTLANKAASADALMLKLKPGCNPLVTRFNPISWRMDNGELLLLARRGQSWRFEENDANTWQRVPETADPVLLVRQ